MIMNESQAREVQEKYRASGRAGLAPAVRRYMRRAMGIPRSSIPPVNGKVALSAGHISLKNNAEHFGLKSLAKRVKQVAGEIKARKIPSTMAELKAFLEQIDAKAKA